MSIEDMNDPIDIELEEIQKTEFDDEPIIIDEEPVEKSDRRVVEPEEGLEALKGQLERERQARADAERRAQEAATSAYYANNEVQDSNLHLVNNAIDTIQNQNNILKANFKNAMENGDYDSVVEIQEAMSDNAAKLMQLEQGKQALETTPRGPAPVYVPSDPVEALASQLTPRSADWVRSHPEYATDQRLNQKMLAAHQLAVADGISPDTDEYFSSVERVLGIGESRPAPKRQSAPPAAPVSRSGSGTGSSNPNHVTLSGAEREMAELMGMTPKEYAQNKLALKRAGRLN
jgi:phage I-like protein